MEVFRKLFPIVLPGLDDNGILFSPFGIQVQKFCFGCFFADCLIDKLQVLHEFLLMLTAHIFDGVTNLMYDAKLDNRIRIYTADSIRKTFEPVNTGYKDILYPPVL